MPNMNGAIKNKENGNARKNENHTQHNASNKALNFLIYSGLHLDQNYSKIFKTKKMRYEIETYK